MINNPENRDQVMEGLNHLVIPFVSRFGGNQETLARGAEMTVTLAGRLKDMPLSSFDEKTLLGATVVLAVCESLITIKNTFMALLEGLDSAGHH